MSRLTEDDVRRIIREELAGGAPVVHVHNPADADPKQVAREAAQYVRAYMDPERPRGAQLVTIPTRAIPLLAGLRLLHPDKPAGWLINEAKRLLDIVDEIDRDE